MSAWILTKVDHNNNDIEEVIGVFRLKQEARQHAEKIVKTFTDTEFCTFYAKPSKE